MPFIDEASVPLVGFLIDLGMARQLLICIAVLALIIVPFVLAGERADRWSTDVLQASTGHPRLVAAIIVALLVADVLLPIPSSLISITGGVLLGFIGGFLASLAGMTGGAMLAYWLGRSAGLWARRFVGSRDADTFEAAFHRSGDWLVVASRPVPVLAESIPMLAGIAGMPFVRFSCLAVLANIGVSAVYAFVGAFAGGANSFLLAFAGAMLVPLGPMVWLRTSDVSKHAKPTPK
jgi:uncharacterized membrane protein YdjX (TVP38/TMEM64 family)